MSYPEEITDAVRISFLAAIQKKPEKEFRYELDKRIMRETNLLIECIKLAKGRNNVIP